MNFQCFRLVDPRSWYKELNLSVQREYFLQLPSLYDEAMERWDHDVSVSLLWGRDHDPKYEISPFPRFRSH